MYPRQFLRLYNYGLTTDAASTLHMRIGVIILGMLFGIFLMWKAKKSIEMQEAFYRFSNWKIEPISMEKELKRTRIRGFVVFVIGLIMLLCMIN